VISTTDINCRKATYERPSNAHSEGTLVTKMHMVKRRMNALLTRDKAILVVKLNTRDEAAYERPAINAAKLCSNELAVKH